ncbi:hypothetical protein LINPERPRIM_LOCUS41384 [Linum perenne]
MVIQRISASRRPTCGYTYITSQLDSVLKKMSKRLANIL